MIAVLDVSAAVEILLKKEKYELYAKTLRESSWVLAPDLYVSEISNVLWKYYKAQAINHEACLQYVEDGISMVDDFFAGTELWKEALSEGIKNSHSVYDMYYLVLARRNDGVLITNDGPLATICEKLKVSICY